MSTIKVWNDPPHRESAWHAPIWEYEIGNPVEIHQRELYGVPILTVGRRFANLADCDHDNCWMVRAEIYLIKSEPIGKRMEFSGFADQINSYDDAQLQKVYNDALGTRCGYPCDHGYCEKYLPPPIPGMKGKFVVVSLEIS